MAISPENISSDSTTDEYLDREVLELEKKVGRALKAGKYIEGNKPPWVGWKIVGVEGDYPVNPHDYIPDFNREKKELMFSLRKLYLNAGWEDVRWGPVDNTVALKNKEIFIKKEKDMNYDSENKNQTAWLIQLYSKLGIKRKNEVLMDALHLMHRYNGESVSNTIVQAMYNNLRKTEKKIFNEYLRS